MKDYYMILGLEPSSGRAEIKRAYRQLAHQFHPDKNGSDPYAAARFTEIKEAYEVLSNPSKKENYLEQRWFEQSMGRKKAQSIVTPESVLKQAIEFDRHVSRLDIHRMNKEGLFHYINDELLPPDTIEKLNQFNEKQINREIILFLLKTLHVIPYHRLGKMEEMLSKINLDTLTEGLIRTSFQEMRKDLQSEKQKVWILLFVVIAILILIYFSGK